MTETESSPDRPLAGIAVGLLAIVTLVLMNASAKWLTTSYPIGQISFFRCFFALLPVAFLVWRSGGVGSLGTRRPGIQVLRGALMVGGMLTYFYGLKFLQLAEANAIFFVEPLLVILLSVVLLREKVDRRLLLAAGIGFCGVLVILRPGSEALKWAALLPLATALFSALWMITGRSLGQTDAVHTTTLYTTVVATLLTAISLPFGWVLPNLADLGVFVLVGIFGGLSTYLYTLACQYTRASVIAPFDYSSIVWAALFGYMIWGELPELSLWLGAAIIAGSGLYIIARQAGDTARAGGKEAPARK